jgi:hypothetical protein
MLLQVTKAIRIRAALVLAILFGVCTIAPSLALAFADGAATAHCLTDDHHGTTKSQEHDRGTGKSASHSHSDQGESDADKSDAAAPGSCCSVFCLTALSASPLHAFGPQINTSSSYLALQDVVSGSGPGRINRPPIVSLPM